MQDEGCHSDIIERIKEYDITSVETNFDKFKNDFNYCKEVKNKFFIETKKKRIDQLRKKQVSNQPNYSTVIVKKST